ncbi:MAG: phosphoenolpyruvate synthase [Chloroflexi bacterium]|nr:phosphoenolpyruvate synthase [Chloroflexota bacterium]
MTSPTSAAESHFFPDLPYVLPFAALDRGSLAEAGGKAANLGELTRAGFPVPPGFCVTTAAYDLVAAAADLDSILDELAVTPAEQTAQLATLAVAARGRLLAVPVLANVRAAILDAYHALTPLTPSHPVAVRSSATAEDLPSASFAGQQDTYLNVVGDDALVDAVRRCWSSLWTDRAVAYRASNGIDHRAVRLAVVIQQMVDAEVAGVMFTADPLTGRRRQAVVDASPGLGEAIVSGAVNPDHFVVDVATGEILERRLGDKRTIIRSVAGGGTEHVELAARDREPCLSDSQLRELAALGAQVETHYGWPQDTEWAIDGTGRLWLTQSRPITTLFPLPPDVSTDDLRVYFSINVAQGVFRPFTPMGAQLLRLFVTAATTLFGRPPRDPIAGPTFMKELAGRLHFDVTPALRSTVGRKLVVFATGHMEARSSAIFRQLGADPRFAPTQSAIWPIASALVPTLVRTRLPLRVARALARPDAARVKARRRADDVLRLGEPRESASALERLDQVERLVLAGAPRLLPHLFPLLIGGLGSYALANLLVGESASTAELQVVLRALPHNPTTEMDLALWHLAERVRADVEAARTLLATPVDQLTLAYRRDGLPPTLQRELRAFLAEHGARAVAEIDVGVPRWSEDPSHLLGVLANYLRLDDPALAPDVQFRKGAAAAEAMIEEIVNRVTSQSRVRGRLTRFFLGRVRELLGLREVPKLYFVKLLARARALLWPVGRELARTGRLEAPDDVFFLTLPEARAAVAGADLRSLVRERRADYERELRRRHLPRVLLSDGTEPTGAEAAVAAGAGVLTGTPASPGTVTGTARVILNPVGAHLEPGEILVAPSTDPGWTPLFLTAGGLVMEMGGAMSHGSVVAREYGIPAVVGVAGATERITTGQQITVDGIAGVVQLPVES